LRRLKILQVITGLGPGGAERLVLDMVHRFDTDRFEVRIVSLIDNLRALEVYGHYGQAVEVFDLHKGRRLTNLWKMRKFLKSFAPDVIHAHMFHSLVAAIALTRFMTHEPAICFTSHLNRYPLFRNRTVRLLKSWRQADVIFEPNQHPDMNVAHTCVFPNGVPVSSLPPARTPWCETDTLRLLSVGRLAEQKDPVGLLRSLARADLPHWTLDFVGSGPLEEAIRVLAADLRLEHRVNILGVRSDVRQLMRNANVFLMHSKYEGMPMALLEAGAEAMPVVATPVGSIPEIIGNDRGVLARPECFTEALCSLISTPNDALSMGRELWTHISKKHSIESTTKAHEHLYQELVKIEKTSV
jgi:glycosyltransferase involved in cell wall biosynthesis